MTALKTALLMCGTPLAAAEAFTVPSFEVAVEENVVYGTAEGYWSSAPVEAQRNLLKLIQNARHLRTIELKMDIYTPEGDDSPSRPLMLMMHGGAYLFGNKNELGQTGWCQYFASLGYVAASIDYRLGFQLNKESVSRAEQAAVEDACNALLYLLGRSDLRIDPERIFLAGTSAGGTTALTVAYDPPIENVPWRIRAIGDLWGYTHDLGVLENGNIPILSFQSERDPLVPYREGYPLHNRRVVDKAFGTLAVYEKASELGITCEHHPCPEKRHMLHLDKKMNFTPRFYEIRDRMAAFFAEEMDAV